MKKFLLFILTFFISTSVFADMPSIFSAGSSHAPAGTITVTEGNVSSMTIENVSVQYYSDSSCSSSLGSIPRQAAQGGFSIDTTWIKTINGAAIYNIANENGITVGSIGSVSVDAIIPFTGDPGISAFSSAACFVVSCLADPCTGSSTPPAVSLNSL
ncbi:MAG: hypothetical protein P1U34_04815 [Coxiellaceae bacterium]|nr:hypothetical protein [Coxiellaceae bacterium]